jgi:hypothetical protein
MAIGAGNYAANRTILHRLPTNPMDRSTIVTLIPKILTEYKPTLFPGRFVIPAAKPGDYELFVVEPSSYFLANATDRMPPTEVQVNSVELAKSIVLDYCVGIIECNMADRMPGLFWIPGEFTKTSIVKYVGADGRTFQQLLDEAKAKQRNWYMALVSLADLLWSRSQNPRAISDDSRLAADFLNFKDKPWMQDRSIFESVNCKYCGELINPAYPVCKHCHAIIDVKKAKELDIQFAAK